LAKWRAKCFLKTVVKVQTFVVSKLEIANFPPLQAKPKIVVAHYSYEV
jgi:hypothetical protein